MSTIAEQWASFEAEVITVAASESQRVALRQAFYGGAGALYALIGRVESADVSEAQGIVMLDRLAAELEAFAHDAGKPPSEGEFSAELDRLVAQGVYTESQAAEARAMVQGLAARAERGTVTREQAESELSRFVARLHGGGQ
jgi:hypothetical protein